MSNFSFLDAEWPELADEAAKAERLVYADPRTACFYARRTLEFTVGWLYKHDKLLRLPYQDNLAALLAEPTFTRLIGPALVTKTDTIKRLGNIAVHGGRRVADTDAVQAVRELFHITYWVARTYGRRDKPAPGLTFNPAHLPKPATANAVPAQTQKQLQALETSLAERDERLTKVLGEKAGIDAELTRLRTEIADVKKANAALLGPDTHDYSETETRDYFIDLLLKEAGWPLDQPRDREFPVTGMPTTSGNGFVDYVLWGRDGKPLGLVEAKRTRADAAIGQQQAKLYADCLERMTGQRPVIFFTNGYEHWVWDDTRYPPRPVHGFFTHDELELAIQRRTTLKPLVATDINTKIAGRYYQTRAIMRVADSFGTDHMRKALLVMATGSGKTRTVIALADLLMKANWVKRVLFLADRKALVKQAHKAFNAHLPNAGAINLLDNPDGQGRVMVATYPTMMSLINKGAGGDSERRFGPGHFDLIVIDEAHRSIYQKYRAIFDYFDSFLVGLTATPRDEIDRNTYSLFQLQDNVPTDVYSLDEAVAEKNLVGPRSVSVPLKIVRAGIKYDQLSDEEKEDWDAKEWSEDGEVPTEVDPAEVNARLFNDDTVDKVLRHLMERGERVAGGDRLGKTIIFAKNSKHAAFIQSRFDINYPHLKGSFAQVIDYSVSHAQSLIDEFSKPEGVPHIAISVDMMDTGIDVPEVVNLVFFKMVRSKTKFWQMLGRGTRLCPDLHGPGQDKTHFWIFDYCMNLEHFSQEPPNREGSTAVALSERLFRSRVELIAALDKYAPTSSPIKKIGGLAEDVTPFDHGETAEQSLRSELAIRLRDEVAAMPPDNFLVRPKRRLVEHFARAESWASLSETDIHDLSEDLASLPSALTDKDVEAKLFDALMLRLQLARLRADREFPRLAERVRDLAHALENSSAANIAMVAARLPLLQEVQTDEFWQDVTVPRLDTVRKQMRELIKFIEKVGQKAVYTSFADEIGEGQDIALPITGGGQSYERFREKVRHFLLPRENDLAMQKLRLGLGLTHDDLTALDQMLQDANLGSPENYAAARNEGLGLFIRSLVGLDRQAAKQAFEKFLAGQALNANQQTFINLIIDELTRTGVMDPVRLYESPYSDTAPTGPQALLGGNVADGIAALLNQFRQTAEVN
jgi:type I restriction enzyme, R subunit